MQLVRCITIERKHFQKINHSTKSLEMKLINLYLLVLVIVLLLVCIVDMTEGKGHGSVKRPWIGRGKREAGGTRFGSHGEVNDYESDNYSDVYEGE